MSASTERIVRCPGCGGDSLYTSRNLYRPFCSERCKNVDLGAWANEQYRVESRPSPDDLADGDLTPPPAS